MYFGKPVCCFLLEEVRQEFFPDCPIVNCSIDTLEEKLAWLLDHPEDRERIGRQGHVYAKKHFDSEMITDRLLDLYQNL
jgi:glycosyltransferase involved in cell wall biosynthesis